MARIDGVDAACSCAHERTGEAAGGGTDVVRDAAANVDGERSEGRVDLALAPQHAVVPHPDRPTSGYERVRIRLDDPTDREIRIFEIVLFALFTVAVVVILRRAGRTGFDRGEMPSVAEATLSPDGAHAAGGVVLDPAESSSEEETAERVG